jgi:hypothetical protein
MEQSTAAPRAAFLPVSRADMEARGWDQLDFVVVGGDAYVDHPSFGTAIISRVLEAEGYRVGVLAQPRYDRLRGFPPVRPPEVRLYHRRRQRGQHGEPLFRGKRSPAPRTSIRPAARPARGRTAAPPCTRSLPRRRTPICP